MKNYFKKEVKIFFFLAIVNTSCLRDVMRKADRYNLYKQAYVIVK